jgi:hypothetical protein
MKPVPFIVGWGRSGTTLLRAMLAAHPEMAVPPESHFLVPMAGRRYRYERDGALDARRFLDDLFVAFGRRMRVWSLEREDVVSRFDRSPPATFADAMRAVYAAYAEAGGRRRYGDKTPIHVLHVDMLAALFPETRFIHIVRDGRDTALSYLDQTFGPNTIAEAAVRWQRAVRAGRRSGRLLGPGRYREVRYEDLLDDPEAHVRDLCAFVDLEFDRGMLDYHERADSLLERGYVADVHPNLRRPPTPGLREWRRDMTLDQVRTFDVLAGEGLKEFGYARAESPPPLAARLEARRQWAVFQARRAAHRVGKLVRRGPARNRDSDVVTGSS